MVASWKVRPSVSVRSAAEAGSAAAKASRAVEAARRRFMGKWVKPGGVRRMDRE